MITHFQVHTTEEVTNLLQAVLIHGGCTVATTADWTETGYIFNIWVNIYSRQDKDLILKTAAGHKTI